MTFTGDESFAEPLRFTNELRLRRAGDRLGQALSSTPVTGHSLGIFTAPPPPTPRKMRAPDREKSDLTSLFLWVPEAADLRVSYLQLANGETARSDAQISVCVSAICILIRGICG